MSERERRDTDLALAPNEYAYIMDTTKGQVNTYVGPHKASLSQTDEPVIFNYDTKKFERVSLEDAKQLIPTAPEGWYITLKNPAHDNKHPPVGTPTSTPALNVGSKVNISGPVSFAPWPGQMVRVVRGHRLRQNQYLLTRIYNKEAVAKSINETIATGSDGEPVPTNEAVDVTNLATGQLHVIKGTDVSFYIPPTGVEVVRYGNEYVRDAVTLERLEYCLLLDQNGGKRYVQGPAVVFPEPTEEFVGSDENTPHSERKFPAIELNENSGLYIKVIADYNDDGSPVSPEQGADHKIGDELFITGKEKSIYFPREEHAIIKYGSQEKHYGIAIPKGEARYVLNRLTGDIRLEKGPSVFLADPRKEVVVRRILDSRACELLYPGNEEALKYNIELKSKVEADGGASTVLGISEETPFAGNAFARVATNDVEMMVSSDMYGLAAAMPERQLRRSLRTRKSVGDAISRGTKYTPPRTVTLNTKYDGAVTINVYEGYAVMLTDKNGNRRVIQGPQTALLEYDENPHFLSLSTGKPKNTDALKDTVYLRVRNNYVTDIVSAETSDFCNVNIKISYRVNFTGDNPEHWFSVENYVKLLCDHMRSMVRNFVKKQTVGDFYQNNASMLRDLILGAAEDGKRSGRLFEENNMHIYDIEVLSVSMDDDIENMLIGEQRDVIQQTLQINKNRRELSFTKENEDLKRKIQEEKAKTNEVVEIFTRSDYESRFATEMMKINSELSKQKAREVGRNEMQSVIDAISKAERDRRQADAELDVDLKRQRVDLDIKFMEAEAEQTKRKAEAITPDLVAALRSISDADTITKVAEALGPMQMLKVVGGESIAEVLSRLLSGSPLGERLSSFTKSNGKNIQAMRD